jgi:hypothetical protein
LSKSADKFKIVAKDRLFYNRFEYVMSFKLDEVSCLRILDHANIDLMMKRRQEWREVTQHRWLNAKQNTGVIVSRRNKLITQHTIDNLHTLAETLLTTDKDFKLVVSSNQAWVYTNEPELFDILERLPILQHKTYAQVQVNRPANTLKLKNSKYSFRSYFKFSKLTALQKDQLIDFLINQQTQVRLSPSLKIWIDQPFNRVQDYFFIDYKTASWTTMLALVHPGLIRKTLQIIPAK